MNDKDQLKQILSKHDLQSEEARKKAYQECGKYADENIPNNVEYNAFMEKAAKKLNQTMIRKDTVKANIEESGREKLHLTYSPEGGPVLTGNQEGLVYLSKLAHQLAQAKEQGGHTHLYAGDPPLFGDSYPLTIYYEEDQWFWRYSKEDQKIPKTNIPERSINPDRIYAFLVTDRVPPTLPFSANRIYKVLSVEKYQDQSVWIKQIREDRNRVYVVSFINNQDQKWRYGVDLDDPDVIFLREEDCTQLKQQD